MRAATGLSHDARSVRIVDNKVRAELIADLPHRWEIRDVAFHREDAVGDHPDRAGHFGVCPRFRELLPQRVEIVVAVDRLEEALFDDRRETHAVDDRRMVEFIGDDNVACLAERREDRLVRVPAARKGVRRFNAVELGDTRLERVVAVERAADEAHACRTRAVLANARDARLDDLRMIRETEVVVRAEARDFAVILQFDGRVHRTFDRLQVLELPALAKRLEDLLRARGEGWNGE